MKANDQYVQSITCDYLYDLTGSFYCGVITGMV